MPSLAENTAHVVGQPECQVVPSSPIYVYDQQTSVKISVPHTHIKDILSSSNEQNAVSTVKETSCPKVAQSSPTTKEQTVIETKKICNNNNKENSGTAETNDKANNRKDEESVVPAEAIVDEGMMQAVMQMVDLTGKEDDDIDYQIERLFADIVKDDAEKSESGRVSCFYPCLSLKEILQIFIQN